MLEYCNIHENYESAKSSIKSEIERRISLEKEGEKSHLSEVLRRNYPDKIKLFNDLDNMKKQSNIYAAHKQWYGNFIERGEAHEDWANILREWLETGLNPNRFDIAAKGLSVSARRSDLFILDTPTPDIETDEKFKIMNDTKFMIMSRSLS